MTKLFQEHRIYVLGDPGLEILGSREKLAQWRHRGVGPNFYRLGRKIVYHSSDLNDWAEANRVEYCSPVEKAYQRNKYREVK